MTDPNHLLRNPADEDGGGGEGTAGARAIDDAPELDPANQSLAEALRITFFLLQLVMVVLVGLWALSGLTSIPESQRGTRLLFGKVNAQNLEPGFHLAAPYPIGDVVRVDIQPMTVTIDRDFWQGGDAPNAPREQMAGKTNLDPAVDGSVLTADGAVAHTRWKVVYHRSNPTQYSTNIFLDDEAPIVIAAVHRGIVQAIAATRIDDLLKESSSEAGSVASRAQDIAQAGLDRLNSGISIDQLTMTDKMPPAWTLALFNKVLSESSNADKKREEATSAGAMRLSEAAGAAVPFLNGQIDLYEAALEKGDQAEAERILSRIFAIMEGRPVEIDGKTVENVVSGQVSSIINDAARYRTEIVNRRRADAAQFHAKLAQFKASPSVMLTREWTTSVGTFMGRDSVQAMFAPPETDVVQVLVNADPDIVKDLDRASRSERIENRRNAGLKSV